MQTALLFILSLSAVSAQGLLFEPNKGQTDSKVQYVARTTNGAVFVTDNEIVLHRGGDAEPAVRIAFPGGDPKSTWQAQDATGKPTHYFIGRDPNRWIRGLQSYRKLLRKDLYPGVDLVLYGNGKDQLEYDLVVAPLADPSPIRIRANTQAKIDAQTGDLILSPEVRQHKPVLLQGTQQVAGQFKRLPNGDFGFAIGAYDRSKPLTIDPVIEARRYFGGSGEDSVNTVAGNINFPYSGTTSSIDFPGSRSDRRHGTDVFFVGDFGTFIIGGSGDETAAPGQFEAYGGCEWVAGTTTSRDLPTAANAKQQDFAGGASDGFVACFLTPIIGFDVTYLGTAGDDRILSLASNGTFFAVAGTTNGTSFATALNPRPGSASGGGFDAFIAISVSGGYKTTIFGGSGDDAAYAVRFTATGSIVAAGETTSPNFPLTSGVLQSQRRGTTDAFVTRFSNDLAREASTLLGGASADRVNALTILPDGNLAAWGTTASTDFPRNSPLQLTYGGGASDAFLTVLNPALTQMVRSTFYGGTGADEGLTISSDATSNIVAGGRTSSRDLAVADANQSTYGGGTTDGFVLRYSQAGAFLPYASYFGGSGDDEVLSVNAVRAAGFSIGGSTTSIDLPGSDPGPFEARRAGTKEGFVAVFSVPELRVPARLFAAKNTYVTLPAQVGDPARYAAAKRVSIRSSDASRVLVSFGSNEPYAQDTLVWDTNLPFLMPRVECIADNGSAVVTLSIPGFTDQTTSVTCVPGELQLTGPSTVSVGGFSSFAIEVVAIDPLTGTRAVRTPSPSANNPFPELFVSGSNPEIVKVTFRRNRNDTGRFADLQGLRYGDVMVSVASPGFASVSRSVKVVSPLPAATEPILVSAGYMIEGRTGTGSFFGTNVDVAIRSTDPSRVLLTVNPNFFPPTASITARDQFFISALPGVPPGTEVNIELTYAGAPEPSIRTLRFVQPVVGASSGLEARTRISLIPGQSFDLDLRLRAGRNLLIPNNGQPAPVVTITNRNPAAATVPANFLPTNITPGVVVTGVAPGTSTIRLLVPAGIQLAPELEGGIEVVVGPKAFTIEPPILNVGKDLSHFVNLRFPVSIFDSPSVITCSTTSPAIRLGPSTVVAGTSRVVLASSNPNLVVTGLESQGTATFVCDYPGYDSLTTTVNLRPSGFVWNTDQIFTSDLRPVLRLFPAALDPSANIPIAEGLVRFGLSATPTVQNSNPSVARYVAGQNNATVLGVGQTIFSIEQPAGFATPAIRQRVQVNVPSVSSFPTTPTPIVRTMIIGRGSVTGTVPCTDATSPCVQALAPAFNTSFTFTAVPAAGFRFDRWEGPCQQTANPTCTGSTEAGFAITAVFVPDTPGFLFVPRTPCRAIDTRNPAGPLAGPALAARTTRNFPLRSACGLPANAVAYSVNVTAVPRGPLGFLTVWPSGQPQPTVSTLNSLDGRIKANAAIIAAGTSGSVDFYATDTTDVIVDINGAFVPRDTPGAEAFYSVTPCRVLDTRVTGGTLAALSTRAFNPASNNNCGLGFGVSAYVLNVTAIPKRTLGFLTLWQGFNVPRPTASTLNAVTGAVTANMAIIPAGTTQDSVSAFVTDDADLVIDVTGYFGRPGQPDALLYNPITPCRALDTRLGNGAEIPAGGSREIPAPCGVPSTTVRAYAVNATVVPPAVLGYLTLFPTAVSRPEVSTLNAVDGALTSNAAIVPAGLNGAITAFVTERTHLIVDINGYFAK